MDKDTRNILLGCLIALVIIVGVIYAIKYFEKRDYYSEDNYYQEQDSMDSYYRENSIKVDIETNKKTEYKDYLLHDGNILVEVHNENGYNTSARIYVEFFDSNKETIAIRDGYINYIGSHKKAYEEIAVEKGLQDLYETYEVKVMSSYEYEKYTKRYYHDKDIEFISLNRDQLKFKNNYNKKLDGTWALLYYDKNDKIIGYSQEYFYKAKPHKTTTLDAYIEHCDYSRIEVILLEADNY